MPSALISKITHQFNLLYEKRKGVTGDVKDVTVDMFLVVTQS